MSAADTAPSDMRIMGIVHDALRRDLTRAIDTLSGSTPVAEPRRGAIARHVEWMMGFLHQHHHGEDEGVWPVVRSRRSDAAVLLADMEADHAAIAPLIERVKPAARRYGAEPSGAAASGLMAALQDLCTTLLPHLEREEAELVPIISVTMSAAEWHAIEQEYYVGPKSMAELGFEGHWLLDGLDAERADVVTHTVPALARLVLVRGFAGRYRRHAVACWGDADRDAYRPARPLPRHIPRTGHVEAVVQVPIDAVWRVVSDVTRVPEWSRECRHVTWSDGATEAIPGARFRGANQAGPWRWTRINEVEVADEPRRFVWRTVPSVLYPDSSRWTIELNETDDGTRIVQSYEVLRAPKALTFLYSILVPSHRGRAVELDSDLHRLGEVAKGVDSDGTRPSRTRSSSV